MLIKKFANNGYATEAAKSCLDYAFGSLGFKKVYSYMKYTNIASAKVAQKNGVRFEFEYKDPKNIITKVYSITLEDYKNTEI